MHNDYPLALEKLAISYDMLSDYCEKIADEYRIEVGHVKKLIPNSGNKNNYVLYCRDLEYLDGWNIFCSRWKNALSD